ncbi:unnamed protein product, partial [Cladocopium goreaui]
TQCLGCMKEYHTAAKLKTHLLRSEELIDVQIGNTLNAPCKGKVRAQHTEGATDQSCT